jgi:hypothetical protein
LAVFVIGLTIGAVVRTRTVTHTATVYATTVTGVPAGCREAITLTRRLENTATPEEIPALTRRFDAAAAGCQIPEGCRQALTYFPRIVTEQSRAKLIALGRAFDAAAAQCQ